MPLSDADRERVVAELGRSPTPAEAALFENLWSEHCAYRSSRPLLGAFDAEAPQVVVGPGDDAAVVALPGSDDEPGRKRDGNAADAGDTTVDADGADVATDDAGGSAVNDADHDWYVTFGIESHNHPSYVDPYDGAATGVGGIVRDTLSMGAYPIALADSLYFGDFDREHSRYLFEGVVEGIADYGNAIGVPTVAGSVTFHEGYVGNPLVNVACVGLLRSDRLVTAEAQSPGNALVLVGNATGRDGLGGAAFASEDLAEDAETEDRPAVQVGDPYSEKLLIEANEALLDDGLVESARDLGAAGLGGASSELVAKGGLGATIDLDDVHQREPGMSALEILLSESQERMCYEVRPGNVESVRAIAERYDLGCSVVGEVTEGNYVCRFEGEPVVDVPAEFLADGAPTNDLERAPAPEPPERDLPDVGLAEAVEAVVGSPNAVSREWVYRQYDHEVGLRTAVPPGDDAALLSIHEADCGLALTAGATPAWTVADAYEGARAVALAAATDLAAAGARPLAAVDCLNGGNPETPDVYGAFARSVDGLADACRSLSIPVVGGNVSLYNDSASGPIPPTPTVAMLGATPAVEAPPATAAGRGDLYVLGGVGASEGTVADPNGSRLPRLGGSEFLARCGGTDRFPTPPDAEGLAATVDAVRRVARLESTVATDAVSRGGLADALAELVGPDAGVEASVPSIPALVAESPGRVIVETTDADALRATAGDVPVARLGRATADGTLSVSVAEESVTYGYEELTERRDLLARELD
jgi:phosphoribosylformylglycinamidine synthase